MVDHNRSFAELLDIAGVMRGQKHGHSLSFIHFANQIAYFLFGDDVQTDRRLIQEQHFRTM